MYEKVAIVILNWNGKSFLEKFLPSLIKYSGNAEIIVADNLSSDDSIHFLETHYPNLRIIQNNENGGYAKGYNQALAHVDSEYYILLNSDIEVSENWLEPLVGFMEQTPNAAAIQPKIRAYHQKSHFEYAGASGGYIDYLGYPFCRGRIFDVLEEDNNQYNDPVEVFWATGACMMVRSEAFHRVGGLDSDFFAHMEEIDLCWRLQNTGYQNYVVPESVVYHVGGGTLPKNSPFKTYLNFRNNLLLLHKNLKTRKFIFILPIRLILDGVAGVKFLLSGQLKDVGAIIKAHFHFYGRMRNNARKKLKPSKKLKTIYNKSIVFQHYAKGKKHFSELKF
jgi:GT2 family glycosyltransferase